MKNKNKSNDDITDKFINEIEDNNLFIPNKPKLDLTNYYKLIDDITKKQTFSSCKKCKIQEFPLLDLIIVIFFSITFYLLFLTVILTGNSIFYFILIYFIGLIVQVKVFPIPCNYNSKIEFENDIYKLLKSSAEISLTKYKKITCNYPGKYIFDITGDINIPKDIKFVKFGNIQYYVDEGIVDFKKHFDTLYGKSKLKKKLMCDDKQFSLSNLYYDLSSDNNYYSITIKTRILSFLLLEWIEAIYYNYFSSNCIIIYPAKLISKQNNVYAETKINIHGNVIENKYYVVSKNDTEQSENLEQEYLNNLKNIKEKKEKEKEEKRKEMERKQIEKERRLERQRDRENNTEILCNYKTNNFNITFKKIYDEVYAYLVVYQKNKNIKKEIDLGEYEEYAEEEIIDKEGNSVTYYPKGKDIKIEFINFEYKYIIKIGTIFSESYYYYSNS